jgi:hypothetical protein
MQNVWGGKVSILGDHSISHSKRKSVHLHVSLIILIGIAVGGVQLGPLGTAATNRAIVPAPGDYDDG